MLKRKDKVVKSNNDGIVYLFKKNKVTFFHGRGAFGKTANEIVVGEETLQAKHVILATGSNPRELPGTPFDEPIRGTRELERLTLEAPEIEGVVLRYGWFYGPGTYFAPDGSYADRVRKRGYPIVGDGGGITSFIHVDDAAAATVRALEQGSPGLYNVVDDDPARLREWLPVYAELLGAKPPRSLLPATASASCA